MVATEPGDLKWQNRAKGELGLLAGVNGDVAAAGLALFQAIDAADKLGDVAGHLQFSIWLAHGMAVNGMPERALSLIDRATEFARRSGYTETPLALSIAKIRALMLLGGTSEDWPDSRIERRLAGPAMASSHSFE